VHVTGVDREFDVGHARRTIRTSQDDLAARAAFLRVRARGCGDAGNQEKSESMGLHGMVLVCSESGQDAGENTPFTAYFGFCGARLQRRR
jgi:hypothetical protein